MVGCVFAVKRRSKLAPSDVCGSAAVIAGGSVILSSSLNSAAPSFLSSHTRAHTEPQTHMNNVSGGEIVAGVTKMLVPCRNPK